MNEQDSFRPSSLLDRLCIAVLACAFALAASVVYPNEAQADAPRFKPIDIYLSQTEGSFGEVLSGSSIQKPEEIYDETFVYLDLRVVLDATSPDTAVTALSDLSPTGTPITGICVPGSYGKLDMAPDLAYSVVTRTQDGVRVTASMYPGDRAENPFNDVFCAFDGNPAQAVFRLRGFFFVMKDQTEDGIFVQLRPINPTPDEAAKFWRTVASDE